LYTRNVEDVESLKLACEVYHVITQDTLNAKSGSSSLSLELHHAVNEKNLNKVQHFLVDALSQYSFELFTSFLAGIFKHVSMKEYLRRVTPVYACMLSDTGMIEIRNLMKVIESGTMNTSTFWESLFTNSLV
jgi:hypothetical protein